MHIKNNHNKVRFDKANAKIQSVFFASRGIIAEVGHFMYQNVTVIMHISVTSRLCFL